jgi:hypothetical protein
MPAMLPQPGARKARQRCRGFAGVGKLDVSITIPPPKGLPFTVPTTAVTEHEFLNAQGFHALIGRDILAHCHFTYNGAISLFTLAY